jgi:hypothetical protein
LIGLGFSLSFWAWLWARLDGLEIKIEFRENKTDRGNVGLSFAGLGLQQNRKNIELNNGLGLRVGPGLDNK